MARRGDMAGSTWWDRDGGIEMVGSTWRTTTRSVVAMCRNITTLRGLEPSATPDEIEAAARQYVRKVSGVQKTSDSTSAAFERAVAIVTAATRELLAELPV